MLSQLAFYDLDTEIPTAGISEGLDSFCETHYL